MTSADRVAAGDFGRTRATPSQPISVLALTKSTGGLAVYHRAIVAGTDPATMNIHTLCLSEQGEAFADNLRALGHSAVAIPMARYRLDLLGDLTVARRTAAQARAHRAQVILCHGSKAGMIGRIVGWRLGIPVVYCQASLPFLARVQGRRAPVYGAIERAARLFGGHIVALTEGARVTSIAHGISTPDRISVIRTGIDTDRFAPQGRRAGVRARLAIAPDAPVVLWMGRFEEQKAPEVFLAAAIALCDRMPRAQVLIVGEGTRRAALETVLAACPHRDRIRILPWQNDPAALMEAADILCLSSRWEGLPLVLLEAMSIGAVPVSTAVDGCAEVIEDGISGRLVPVDDANALCEALVATLSEPLALARMSQAARDRVHHQFSAKRMLAEWQTLLATLANRGGR